MRLLIIRHADPDYVNDTLTEKGRREAELLAEKLASVPIDSFYVSPLGRARDTASMTLERMGRTAEVKDWLMEFPVEINRPDCTDRKRIAWDWLPQDWTNVPEFFNRKEWLSVPVMKEGNVDIEYEKVIEAFDRLIADHGYVRDGDIYRAVKPNKDTLAFFCHFGLECVLLSRLMNVSPMILWHHTCAAPSSVTSLITEERREGTASFRMNYFGDTSHLIPGNEEPSFSARFCEVWTDTDSRHD
ncbi:MAG: histidine phosphatase family protein [Parasporobacterium sp.]|nr:histidine phosphatase family protein [Parasporobacterium sp.]